MIKPFKFFDGDWQQPPLDSIDAPDRPDIPLLENEQIIRFYDTNNVGFFECRTILWRETIHMDRTRFRRRDFIGTMSEFFSDKPFIPPIAFIETTYGHHMCKELNGVGVNPEYIFSSDQEIIIHWYENI